MAILSADIKFVKSAVMDDVPNGGGAPTGNAVPDGQSNAVFPDISELDRAGGRVSLRKLHVTVQTANTDTYLGANVIVAEPPTDPGVSVTLFSTNSTFDERTAAASRIESYLTAGPEWPGFLLENHVAGQRVVQIFQRVTEAMPNIGQTIVLLYNEGLGTERLQYVRVTSVTAVERAYVDDRGQPYQANVVSAEISDALRYDFPGTSPNEYFRRSGSNTKVRETSVADAGIYSGVSKTTAAVEIGDLAATVETVFTQLVPSAQTEIPLADRTAAGTSAAVTQAATGDISYTTSQPLNSTTVLALSNAVTPGTLSIVVGGATLLDAGGQVYDGAVAVGVIDYARGTVAFPGLAAPYNGSKTISFKAAAAPLRVGDTGQVPVTIESRAYNYIVTIDPPPAPGSVLVSYRSNGRWYDLRDNAGGVLKGSDTAYGVGSVNYSSGNVSVTLGALPDVGSSVLFVWNNQVNYINRSGTAVAAPGLSLILADAPITPGTVEIAWNDGVARTATDDGKGLITGGATGTVNYETGAVVLVLATIPTTGQDFNFAYDVVDETALKTATISSPGRNGDLTITVDLGQTNIEPGSIRMEWDVVADPVETNSGLNKYVVSVNPVVHARDNGLGSIITETGRNAGTINYATGVATIQPDGNVIGRREHYVQDPEPLMSHGGGTT